MREAASRLGCLPANSPASGVVNVSSNVALQLLGTLHYIVTRSLALKQQRSEGVSSHHFFLCLLFGLAYLFVDVPENEKAQTGMGCVLLACVK